MAVFVPHITSPKGGEIFNQGVVNITWDKNEPPTDDPYEATAVISYELEYTDDFQFENTVWHTLKRRIPWIEDSFDWVVGKMIKSSSVRIRLRAKNSLDSLLSDWSMSSGDFTINVFKLIPPAIVSPLGSHVYTDFILIILDETLTRQTFSQKVRYTLEYSSESKSIDWTVIAKDVPVGQNVIRWDLEALTPSDDYILRLTAKNAATSCLQGSDPTPDQISRRFVYNIKIQQPGMFFIDTKPPQTLLDIEGSVGVTSNLTHTVNIYAEDDTSDVEQIQIRECDSSQQLALGEISTFTGVPIETKPECEDIADIILADGNSVDFGKLIGKPLGYSTKTQWTLEDISGLRRLEVITTDTGGNTSLQEVSKSFIPIFRNTSQINDLIVATEIRTVNEITSDASGQTKATTRSNIEFEVAYFTTSDGQYWVLEPSPRLLQTDPLGRDFRLLVNFQGSIFIFSYVDNDLSTDSAWFFRDDKSALTFMFQFPNPLSIPNSVAEFSQVLYTGLENGELWSFNGTSLALVSTFSNPISTLSGDNEYLYVGLANSSLLTLYNGSEFFTSDVET